MTTGTGGWIRLRGFMMPAHRPVVMTWLDDVRRPGAAARLTTPNLSDNMMSISNDLSEGGHVEEQSRSAIEVRKLPHQVALVLGRRVAAAGPEVPASLPTEQEISSEFGVSRTVAREALGILRSLDMVSIAQGKRVAARPRREWDYLNPLILEMLDPDDVHRLLAELHDVRLLLEPEIAAWAAQRIQPEGTERLRQSVARMRELEGDPDAYLDEDLAFHMELSWAHENRVLERIVSACRWLLTASRRVTTAGGDLAAVTRAHEQIYLAVAGRDPDAAHAAMVSHLETVTHIWLGDGKPGGRARPRRGEAEPTTWAEP